MENIPLSELRKGPDRHGREKQEATWGCTDDAARKFAGGTANSGASAGSAFPEILQLVPRPPCPGLVKLEENTEPDKLQHRQQQQGNDVLQDNTGLQEHERLEEQLLSLRMN
ncbi:hypothetical protein PM082_022256 [Marasmius tenuissimus]|nr:hypothetical protein PM082_022256 [Marasmius tenuissimus]